MDDYKDLYDLVIVGGGPAGLSAAIYMARARYRVLVVEKEKTGGQITITSEIVNYPGVASTSGRALTDEMREQAEAFGAEFAIAEVMGLDLQAEIKTLHTTKGDIKTLGVVLALGANPRKLGFKGEKEFQGRGVAYCATCDGEFFTGMDLFVIGGGFAAVEEGIFLTKYARKVSMVVRGEDFTCAKAVADEVRQHEKIEVHFNTEILEVKGEGMVNFAHFKNNKTGEEWTHEAPAGGAFGVFVFAGYVPNTAWIGPEIEKDPGGYILTDSNQKTNLDGVYAAGDVCVKNLRQVVTAVADGAVAATSLEKYVSELHTKRNIPELAAGQADMQRLHKKAKPAAEEGETEGGGGFLSAEAKAQLKDVFARFQSKVLLKAWLDDSPLSGEVVGFLGELEGLTDKIAWEKAEGPEKAEKLLPSIELCRENGESSGIQFHGVPGGHEINSFVIALYNVAGPGQELDPAVKQQIEAIDKDLNVKVLVSLSCTMCPEVVMGTQKAAAISPHIQAEMIDLMHYPELKEKYQVMSVPCMVINGEKVIFGKKTLPEIAGILAEAAGA